MQLTEDQCRTVFPFYLVFDQSFQILEIGDALERLLPVPVLGKSLPEYFHFVRPTEVDGWGAVAKAVEHPCILESIQVPELRLRGQLLLAADGGSVTLLATPILFSMQEMKAIGLTLNDFAISDPISDYICKHQADQMAFRDARELSNKLHEKNSKLDTIFELSPDGFISFDQHGRYEYANNTLLSMLDLNRAEVGGWNVLEFLGHISSHCSEISYVSSTDLTSDEKFLISFEGKELDCVQRRSEDGKSIFYFRDVTIEFEIDRMKSEFLTTAAHELRTPMTSIFGYVELMLARRFPEEKQHQMMDAIHRQSKLMIRLINDLLDIARIESKHGRDFAFVPQSIETVVRSCTEDMLLPDNFTMEVDFSQPLPQVSLDADKFKLVINNVLANSKTYSPDGGVIRVAGKYRLGRNGLGEVGVSIADQGIGMNEEQQSRIFERFYRGDKSGNVPGTGLGMSLAKEVMQLHGGQIEIVSQPGAGTEVTLWLPEAGTRP